MDKSFMLEMHLTMERCTSYAVIIHNTLKRNENIKSMYICPDDPPSHHCFRLTFKSGPRMYYGTKITSVSVSVPPDAMGNRGAKYDEPETASTIETALFNEDELVYGEEGEGKGEGEAISYTEDDAVLRTFSIDELRIELERIYSNTT